MAQTRPKGSILALDIGGKRIGVALASLDSKLPSPLVTLENNQQFIANLQALVSEHQVGHIVIGLPRGLDGQNTQQTEMVEALAKQIDEAIDISTSFQDEALTSVKAEEELSGHGRIYQKTDVDKLAATYILQDYINENLN